MSDIIEQSEKIIYRPMVEYPGWEKDYANGPYQPADDTNTVNQNIEVTTNTEQN